MLQFIAILMLGAGFGGLLIPPAVLIMHFIVPKTLLDRYWKPPHFSLGEIAFLSGFPASLMRTVMFMSVVTFPRRGRKRQMEDCRRYAPRWFVVAGSAVTLWVFTCLIVILVTGVGFVIYAEMFGLGIKWIG